MAYLHIFVSTLAQLSKRAVFRVTWGRSWPECCKQHSWPVLPYCHLLRNSFICSILFYFILLLASFFFSTTHFFPYFADMVLACHGPAGITGLAWLFWAHASEAPAPAWENIFFVFVHAKKTRLGHRFQTSAFYYKHVTYMHFVPCWQV